MGPLPGLAAIKGIASSNNHECVLAWADSHGRDLAKAKAILGSLLGLAAVSGPCHGERLRIVPALPVHL